VRPGWCWGGRGGDWGFGVVEWGCDLWGVSVHLVGTAAFKAVEALYKQCLVGSIPIHSRRGVAATEQEIVVSR
jgi:hypothetical protein